MNTNVTNISNQNMLDELGIKYSELPINFNPEEAGYIKVDCSTDMLGRVDSILQLFPEVVNGINSSGSFKVIYDKGLGVLQKAKDHPGLYRANVVNADGGNNNITGQALLAPVSNTAQIISGVFATMSMVTGQYYMCQINNELNAINQKVDLIQSFIENEKESHIKSNIKTIMTIQRDYNSILNNTDRRIMLLNSIQTIKTSSFADIEFFRKQIRTRVGVLNQNSKSNDIDATIKQMGYYIMLYYHSVLLYSYSIIFDMMLSNESDKNCIDNNTSDIDQAIREYISYINECKFSFIRYLESSNAYRANKAVELAAATPIFPLNPILGAANVLKSVGMSAYLNYDQKNKNAQKEVIKLSIDDIDKLLDLSVLTSKKEALQEYNMRMNNKIELVRIKDELYIAC